MPLNPRATKIGLLIAGAAAGGVIATAIGAQAATTTPAPSASSGNTNGSAAADPHPGDNGADGIPESKEQHGPGGHGGPGGALDLSGTVTAVGSSTVTIKTASATATYTVTSTSDIDKNGEAALKDLAVGDAVRFSVEATSNTTIDKLHAGDEAKDMPQQSSSNSTSGSTR